MLHLRTFGGLALERDGVALESIAVRRRPLLLLAFVASHGDVGVSRESVLADFWPESDVAHARNSLKQMVFALRRELGVDVFVPGAATLRIERRALAVDALDLADALDGDDVDGAVALYRGPFLEGVPMPGLHHLERWAERERERFAWACARALEAIAARAAAAGDHASAIAAWRRRAALDPLSGQAAGGLMRALRDAGDATAALEHWRVHEVLVREELGAAPDPSIAALADALRRTLAVRAEREDRPGIHAGAAPVAQAPPGDLAHATAPPAARETAARETAAREVAVVASPPPPPPNAHERRPPDPRAFHAWWRVRPRFAGRLLAVALAALAAPAAMHLGAGAAPTRDGTRATLVAVLPFAVRGTADATDARLGQGVADLVSGAVHGAGDWSAVPPAALLADDAVRARSPLTAAQARQVAHRFGAGRFILGGVVKDGGRVHLAASLHDATGRVLAQAHAAAPDGRLREASDALVLSLLGQQFTAPGDRLTRVAAASTQSLAALDHWLAGEAAFRRQHYAEAVDAFEQAVDADPGLALAHYRLANAADLLGDGPRARAAAERAAARAAHLPSAERRLLRAWQAAHAGLVDHAEREYEILVADAPDHPEAWFRLGELQFHTNPTRGRSATEARPEFERVLAIDPRHAEALVYLARIASLERRPATADSLARRARAATDDDGALELRAVRAFALGEGAVQARALRALQRNPPRGTSASALHLAVHGEDVDAAHAFARTIAAATASREVRALAHRVSALAAAARGQWSVAGVFLDSLAALDLDAELRLRVVLATLPALAPTTHVVRPALAARTAARIATRAARAAGGAGADDGAESPAAREAVWRHRAGLLAATDGNATELRHQAAAIRAIAAGADSAAVRALAAGLEARSAMLDGRPDEALALLDDARVEQRTASAAALPMLEAADRFLRAELLHRLGRDDAALGWYVSVAERATDELPWLAPAQLRLGELYAARGDRPAAIAAYRRFLALWSRCDPALRPMVDGVAAIVARLERQPTAAR